MHDTTIARTSDGELEVSCSCGERIGTFVSQLAAEASRLAHVAGSTGDTTAELSPAVAAIKAEALLKATELLHELPAGTIWTYEIVHGVVAAAYAVGNRDGYRECYALVTAPVELDPRDLT